MKVRVLLAKPVDGSTIIAALKSLAGDAYYERILGGDEDGRIMFVGQRSRFEYANLGIGVGMDAVKEISTRAAYSDVWVVAHDHPGDRPLRLEQYGDDFRERYLVYLASQLCIAITQQR